MSDWPACEHWGCLLTGYPTQADCPPPPPPPALRRHCPPATTVWPVGNRNSPETRSPTRATGTHSEYSGLQYVWKVFTMSPVPCFLLSGHFIVKFYSNGKWHYKYLNWDKCKDWPTKLTNKYMSVQELRSTSILFMEIKYREIKLK